MNSIYTFLLLLPCILLALTIHEVSHGYVAYKFGDPTAKMAGRLTLNPIPHIDPIGFILLLLIHIGWAKPVPVNPNYFRNPERDMVFVALAGPFSNFITGALSALIARFFYPVLPQIVLSLFIYFAFISFILSFFNLIPVPPLDGWRIASYFIKDRDLKFQLERGGLWLLILILLIPSFLGIDILGMILRPLVNMSFTIFLGKIPFIF